MANKRAFDPLGTSYPAADLHAAGFVCVPIPKRAIPFMLGALNPFAWPDAWKGTPSEVRQTVQQFGDILATLVAGDQCETTVTEVVREIPASDLTAMAGSMCGIDEMENCEMQCCIKWIDGILHYYACGEWVPVPGTTSAGEDVDEVEAPPVDNGIWDFDAESAGLDFSACAKATALRDVIWNVAESIFDDSDSVNDLLFYAKNAEEEVGLDLDGWWLMTAMGWGFQMKFIPIDEFSYEKEEVFTDELKNWMLCTILGFLRDDPWPVSEADWRTIQGSIKGHFGGDLLQSDFWGAIMLSIGYANAKQVTYVNALDKPGLDCSVCSGDLLYPSDVDWAYEFDFTAGSHEWVGGTGTDYEAGRGWVGSDDWWDGSEFNLASHTPYDTDTLLGTISFLEVTLEPLVSTERSGGGIRYRHDSATVFEFFTNEQFYAGMPVLRWSGSANWQGASGNDGNLHISCQWRYTDNTPMVVTKVVMAGYGSAPIASPVAY